MRREFQALRLGTVIILRCDFRAQHLGPRSDVETQVSTLAMTSFASEVWILLFNDLSSVIFRQFTEPPPKFSIFRG